MRQHAQADSTDPPILVSQLFLGPSCTPPPQQINCSCLHLTGEACLPGHSTTNMVDTCVVCNVPRVENVQKGQANARVPFFSCRADFSGGAAPKLATASLDQMVSLNPEYIFTKLKYLSAILFGLFGLMLLLSAVAFVHDTRSCDRLLQALRSPQFHFEEVRESGAWLWMLRPQGKVQHDIGHTEGPLAELAKILGAPVIRLRAALPEEWIQGDMGAQPRRAGTACLPAASTAAGGVCLITRDWIFSLIRLFLRTAVSAIGRSVGISAADVTATHGLLAKKLRVAAADVKSVLVSDRQQSRALFFVAAPGDPACPLRRRQGRR